MKFISKFYLLFDLFRYEFENTSIFSARVTSGTHLSIYGDTSRNEQILGKIESPGFSFFTDLHSPEAFIVTSFPCIWREICTCVYVCQYIHVCKLSRSTQKLWRKCAKGVRPSMHSVDGILNWLISHFFSGLARTVAMLKQTTVP